MPEGALSELLDEAPFSPLHRRVWLLASLGIMLDGFDFFIMGVAIPLITEQWHPSSLEVGLITASAVIGAMVGALVLGPLTDRIGRSLAFKIDLTLFVVFALASALAPGIWWLILFRFLLGVGIGADYPISASYVSEIAPARIRTRLLVSSFSFQAVGQLIGVLVGLAVLKLHPDTNSWRWMLAFGVVPAIAIVVLRRRVPESPKWLLSCGRLEQAAEVVSSFVGREVTSAEIEQLAESGGADERAVERRVEQFERAVEEAADISPPSWRRLFTRTWRARTVLCAVPWFLMDIATYGVGVFTPTILGAIVVADASNNFIANDIASTEGAAVVDVFLVVGFALAIVLVERVGKVPMQVMGFVVMAVALGLLAYVSWLPGGGDQHVALVFVGFGVFNLFTNMGPNTTTFVMPAAVFPTVLRATASGFAAAMGKAGAAVGLVLFPLMQDDLGLALTLTIVASGCAVAALVTFVLRAEASAARAGAAHS